MKAEEVKGAAEQKVKERYSKADGRHTGSLMLWPNSLGKTARVTACLRRLVLSEPLTAEEN